MFRKSMETELMHAFLTELIESTCVVTKKVNFFVSYVFRWEINIIFSGLKI